MDHINEVEKMFIEFLNKDGQISVRGLTFDADVIIRTLDKVAYDEGLKDYANSLLARIDSITEDNV
jgi:hypothetical protein